MHSTLSIHLRTLSRWYMSQSCFPWFLVSRASVFSKTFFNSQLSNSGIKIFIEFFLVSMQTLIIQRMIAKSLFQFGQAKAGGNLYTWGMASIGSGIDLPSQPDQMVPRRVTEFNGNVAKVATGFHHTAVITTSGDLYTFGQNNYGQLGLGNREVTHRPTRVDAFAQQGLKVVDVALGANHSVAITSDGGIWSWGWSGRYRIPFLNNFLPRNTNQNIIAASGVGVTATEDLLTPTRVDTFQGQVRPQTISAGLNFSILHDQENHLWGWGLGHVGQLGNMIPERLTYPYRNPAWDQKARKEKSRIVKMKSALYGTIALLENGKLVGWGQSNGGHLGVRLQEFIRDDNNMIPMDVNRQYMKKDEKVVDFDLSCDGLVYYTDQNNVYYTGSKMFYIPNLAMKGKDIPRVTNVAAAANGLAFITENGDLYASNCFVEPHQHLGGHQIFTKQSAAGLFNGGKVLDIGGTYNIRYAVVQN